MGMLNQTTEHEARSIDFDIIDDLIKEAQYHEHISLLNGCLAKCQPSDEPSIYANSPEFDANIYFEDAERHEIIAKYIRSRIDDLKMEMGCLDIKYKPLNE